MSKNLNGIKVCVIYGGESAERQISIESGTSVLAALKSKNIDAFGLDLKFKNLKDLLNADFDLAFIAMHGSFGEDGRLQGILDWMQKPFVGSGVLASAVAMDKSIAKHIWKSFDIKTPKYSVVEKAEKQNLNFTDFNFPLAIKPLHLGSSFGITKVENLEKLPLALEQAFEYDSKVLVEEWIEGEEYTLSLVEGLNLPIIKVETNGGFYDYKAKYEAEDTRFIMPSGLSDSLEKEIQEKSWQAFYALECEDWARADLIVTNSNEIYFLEINTSPGMTSHSLVPMAAKHIGISFEALVVKLCELALKKADNKLKIIKN